MVEQRAWDIVLELIVLSFNCSWSKWKLKSSMVERNMSKFESQTGEFRSGGEFFVECMCTLRSCINVFKIFNSRSIIKISFT
jgi:hypothetical protein